MDQFTRTILRGAALPTAVMGLAITLGALLFGGGAAAVGALLGTLAVVVFFIAGQLILGGVLKHNPQAALMVAMALYLVKIGVLLVLLVLLKGTEMFDTKVFAIAILACTLTWTTCEVVIFSRSKVLYVEPDDVPEGVRQSSDHLQ